MIKVLIVDDSALVRKVFSRELAKAGDIEVVGTAHDPYMARDRIVELKPDVVTLDIEMPRMDGLTFLEKLMKYYPMPVVVVSSLAQEGGETALKALELGAVEVVAKPSASYSVNEMGPQLIQKVRAAACVNIDNIRKNRIQNTATLAKNRTAMIKTSSKVIAIGASTGGTEAIKDVLVGLPANMPPILVVQHMPPYFIKAFAARLNSMCTLEVKEALDGESVTSGKVLISPGNKHMELRRSGANYYVVLNDKPLVHYQRPAVEILFDSVAQYAGSNAIGVILTGMGKDGAKGLLNMKTAGAYTIAQDEQSSIVFGMPKEAINLGAAATVASLSDIPALLIKVSNTL